MLVPRADLVHNSVQYKVAEVGVVCSISSVVYIYRKARKTHRLQPWDIRA